MVVSAQATQFHRYNRLLVYPRNLFTYSARKGRSSSMSNSYESTNPYSASPTAWSDPNTMSGADLIERVRTRVTVPAVFLIVVGSLGLLASIFSCVNALVSPPPPVDPNAPEIVQQFTQGTVGPLAAGLQSAFIALNAFIIFGAVQMYRLKAWPLALTASIAATINCGSCCFILGAPVGIWAIVILSMTDVKNAFQANS